VLDRDQFQAFTGVAIASRYRMEKTIPKQMDDSGTFRIISDLF
jgi:hypothetical protein